MSRTRRWYQAGARHHRSWLARSWIARSVWSSIPARMEMMYWYWIVQPVWSSNTSSRSATSSTSMITAFRVSCAMDWPARSPFSRSTRVCSSSSTRLRAQFTTKNSTKTILKMERAPDSSAVRRRSIFKIVLDESVENDPVIGELLLYLPCVAQIFQVRQNFSHSHTQDFVVIQAAVGEHLACELSAVLRALFEQIQ